MWGLWGLLLLCGLVFFFFNLNLFRKESISFLFYTNTKKSCSSKFCVCIYLQGKLFSNGWNFIFKLAYWSMWLHLFMKLLFIIVLIHEA